MSTWQHRVVKTDEGLALAEVYFDDDGNTTGWCEAFLTGDTIEDLLELVGRLLRATGQPVVEFPS
jgi:hypothetical protein